MKEIDNLSHNYGKILTISSLLTVTKNKPQQFIKNLNNTLESFINQYLKLHHSRIYQNLFLLEKDHNNLNQFFNDFIPKSKIAKLENFFEDLSIDLTRNRISLNKM